LRVENAITLKPITDKIFDYGKSTIEIANQKLHEVGLKEFGITDRNPLKGLGIFTIVLIIYFILTCLYALLAVIMPNYWL